MSDGYVTFPIEEFEAQIAHAGVKGEERERKAIVEWLRGEDHSYGDEMWAIGPDEEADAIEQLTHRRS